MSNLLSAWDTFGVDISSKVLWETMRLSLKRNNWNQLSVTLKDTHGAGAIQIVNNRSSQNLFYGILQSEKLSFLTKDRHLLQVTYSDFDIIFLTWDQYTYDYSAGDHTEKQILEDTLGTIAYPVDPIGAHVINGPLVSPKFSNTSWRRLLDDLAAINDRYWYWDGDAELHYFANTGEAAPFNLSDNPNNVTTFEYGNLVVSQSLGTDNATIYGGSLTCWKDGLWPGMSIQISNSHIPWVAETYIINEVEITWPGGDNAKSIEYKIQFGDVKKSRLTDLVARANQNVSTVDRGIVPPLENDVLKFYRSDGAYAAPVTFGAAGDIAADPLGSTVLAGSTGKVADAGHRHAIANLGATAADVTASRKIDGTVYRNTTGKVLAVSVSVYRAGTCPLCGYIGKTSSPATLVAYGYDYVAGGLGAQSNIFFLVPNNYYYTAGCFISPDGSLSNWAETTLG